MDSKIFCQRRAKLLQLCEEGSMLLLFANSDKGHSFVQNNNFFYLTGLNIPDAILMITKADGKLNSDIFIEQTIPERIVWDGEKMSKEEVKKISGIDNVHYLERFEHTLASLLSPKPFVSINKVHIEGGSPLPSAPLNKPLYLAAKIRERYPLIQFDSIDSVVNPLRMIKDEWEIEQLRKAIALTGKGINSVLNSTIAGKYEYQIEALLYYELLNEGVRNWGFKPIIACGKNATILHYCQNNEICAANNMLLIDIGALYNNYSADITRTYPVQKKYRKRQREVYNEVLQTQKTIINLIEPGMTLKKLQQQTVEMLTESLFKLKLIKKKDDYNKYYMHGVSHFLGMEAHDAFTKGVILEPGHIITVEPGLYIPEEGIGVRIEDDVLITEKGCENLSIAIPKEIEEVEEIRAKALDKSR